jgi:predicted amidohydrolase YtcJ
MRKFMSGILLALFSLVSTAWADGNATTEKVFYNGKIFTGEPEHPYAEAVAIQDDKIVAVGNRVEVTKSLGKNAENIDLHGKTLLPGLIDSHVHTVLAGDSLISADIGDKVQSIADLAVFAADAKKTGKGMRGDILYISGMPLTFWSKTDELNARFNTGVFENQAVYLEGSDGHTGWANRALRLRAGVTKDFLSHLTGEERKYFGVGLDLEPNGFAVDAGLAKIQAALPKPSREHLLGAGRAAVHYLNSLGITSWLDPLADAPILTAYRDLSQRGELTAHVAAFPEVKFNSDVDPLIKVQALRKEFSGVANLTVPGIKIFADGVVEYPSQSAHMSSPYKNTGKNGDLLFDPARFAKLAIAADKQGLIIHIHANGDKAVTESLNGIEAARKANGNSGLPHTITHLQFVVPSDFPRFKQLGVISAYQLFWANANAEAIDLIQPYIDPAVFVWQYPARSILDAGGIISGASDWSVSTPNVFQAIYQAETRKGPEGVLNAAECMPREAMLYAYTRNSAIAMNQLDKIGSIAPGKQADFVLVDRDVLTVPADDLKGTQILWTMVGGKTVFQAKP